MPISITTTNGSVLSSHSPIDDSAGPGQHEFSYTQRSRGGRDTA
jgi:hypothetical protein